MRGKNVAKSTASLLLRTGALLLLLFASTVLSAQPNSGPVTGNLRAGAEFIEVGRPFPVELEVRHPADMVVILPDTGLDFAPYELAGRQPVPTRTDDGESVDFVTYDLRSWSIDSLQIIALPIGYVVDGDTQLTFSTLDTVILMPAITTPIDSLDVMTIDDLAPVREPWDWRITAILIAAPLLLLALLLAILWKPIRRYFRERRLERQYQKYYRRWNALNTQRDDTKSFLLDLARVWKDYVDLDLGIGLSSLSTRELRGQIEGLMQLDEIKRKALLQLNETCDRVTYAGGSIQGSELENFYVMVGRVLEGEFNRRKEAMKNA